MSVGANQSTVQAVEQNILPPGVPPLMSLYMYIAGSCNLACKHCWIVPNFLPHSSNGDAANGKFLEFEMIRKVIEEAMPLGLSTVKLTGGEPLLHPQIRDIIMLIRDLDRLLVIETNGTLLDDELVALIRQCQTGTISISLDGAVAETHDALRGVRGSYADALRGIQILVNAGYRPQLICTLHQGNLAEMEAVITLAEKLGCGSVKFNHVQRIGRGARFGNENGLEIDELIRLYERIKTEIEPQSKTDIYFDIPVAFHSLGKLLKNLHVGCNVQNILGVLDSGDLALCGIGVTMPDLIYGNLHNDKLQNVWYTHSRLQLLRQQVPAQLEGICSNCIHQYTCQGHCIANNYHTAGKLNAPFYFCQHADKLGLFPISRKVVG